MEVIRGMWSRRFDACVNCGTRRRRHRGRGYCTKCYGPATWLAKIESWDSSQLETVTGLPGRCAEMRRLLQREAFRRGLSAELRRRLEQLKTWESGLGKVPDSLTLEHRLRRVAQYAGVRDRNLFYGYANWLAHEFDMRGRTALNDLLIQIEEDRPWRINWYRVCGGDR